MMQEPNIKEDDYVINPDISIDDIINKATDDSKRYNRSINDPTENETLDDIDEIGQRAEYDRTMESRVSEADLEL